MVVSFRRGWTHGVLAQAVLPLMLAGIMLVLARRREKHQRTPALEHPGTRAPKHPSTRAPEHPSTRAPASFAQLALLSYIGVFSHVFLDWLNTYGVRLLMPFSDRWFYGDALFVVDPWLYLVLGAGVWLAKRRERRGLPRPARPAQAALALVSIYVALMIASNLVARATVRGGLDRAGRPADARFMVSPIPVNPFRREVIVDVGDRYEKGFLWFEPWPHFRPAGYGVPTGFDQPEVRTLLDSETVRTYLRWSRFPYFVVERTASPPLVFMNDYRYSDATARPGWAGFRIAVGAEPRR